MELYILIWSEDIPIGDAAFLGVYENKAQAEEAKQQNIFDIEDSEGETYQIIKTSLNQVKC
jgi:hypothetical protein